MEIVNKQDLSKVRQQGANYRLQNVESDSLTALEATAILYEENLATQQGLIDAFDAVAIVYEELLSMKGDG